METKEKQADAGSAACAKCGKPLRAGARFCSACGAPAGSAESASGKMNREGSPKGSLKPPGGLALDSKLKQAARSTAADATGLPRGVGAILDGGDLVAQSVASATTGPAGWNDKVYLVAKWSGAIRRMFIDKAPEGFAATIREILETLATYSDGREPFENFMFISLLTLIRNPALVASVEAAIRLFPDRFLQYVNEPARAGELDVDLGQWKDVYESWPFATFQATYDIPDDQLCEICVQTIHELGVLNLAPNGYMEDEEARIEAGLYPNAIKPVIQRAYAKCNSVDTKEWGTSADQRADTFVKLYAPFAHPENYRSMQAKFGRAVPAPPENLTDWELQQIHAYVADQSYDRREVLNMLVNRWDTLSGQLSRMNEVFQPIFIFQHFLLTLSLNMNNRRINSKQHKDYGHMLRPGSDLEASYRHGIEEKMPFLTRSLWPSIGSLFNVEFLILRQQPG